MNMISKLLVTAALVVLAACATRQPYTYTPAPTTAQAPAQSYQPQRCTWQPAHQTSTGEQVEDSWHCPVVSGAGRSSDCSWVTGYVRNDGTSVTGHYRCTRDVAITTSSSGYSSGYRPSAGGPVRVRGYYRKDGTYVRSHSRKRPRR